MSSDSSVSMRLRYALQRRRRIAIFDRGALDEMAQRAESSTSSQSAPQPRRVCDEKKSGIMAAGRDARALRPAGAQGVDGLGRRPHSSSARSSSRLQPIELGAECLARPTPSASVYSSGSSSSRVSAAIVRFDLLNL